ncbi:ANTAR domain-containing response regulator [Actinomadura sp. HBU206391]|uniref:ANTAR domain-containing response regulator n=1 Tax=Actinomadura sp. HBU206391 TaxID=2731692 RepID=UPI00164F52F6|nr:ANTAR domain-containing protein [Actinomadura sp. HBU206391]MBC6460526.1 ANTAR domain-containing protein [Actinomadura sp. HBU206391]
MSYAEAPSVITNELAVEIARLGVVRDSSEVGTLRRVTDLAARAVLGCAGATTVRWTLSRHGAAHNAVKPRMAAASHPDLAELIDVQLDRGEGPIFDAVSGRVPVSCEDTLSETRWPVHTAAMLRRGVRCFTTTVHETGDMFVTLSLYGVMPGALDPGQFAMAELLVAQGGAAVSNTREYDDAQRTAVQLRQAVAARAVVDQAKGILMHAMGCDADTAFAELRRISQTRHMKLTSIAQRIVARNELPDIP